MIRSFSIFRPMFTLCVAATVSLVACSAPEAPTSRPAAPDVQAKQEPVKSEPAAQEVAAPKAAAATAWKAGDKVDIEWNGSWWQGTILEVSGDSYRVHYEGWSSSWDEAVTGSRLRPRTKDAKVGSETSDTPAKASMWKAGDKIDVEWNGSWWQAKVLAVSGDEYLVHYIGWESSWDETVPADRTRAAVRGTARGTSGD